MEPESSASAYSATRAWVSVFGPLTCGASACRHPED
ncbi:DUF3649 domain-containing protein [Streptomyces sp. NPDC086554]